MIVLTNGEVAIMTIQDTEWNDNGKYADHASNGITNAFRCNPRLVANALGGVWPKGSTPMTHDEVAAVAVEEVSISNEYT